MPPSLQSGSWGSPERESLVHDLPPVAGVEGETSRPIRVVKDGQNQVGDVYGRELKGIRKLVPQIVRNSIGQKRKGGYPDEPHGESRDVLSVEAPLAARELRNRCVARPEEPQKCDYPRNSDDLAWGSRELVEHLVAPAPGLDFRALVGTCGLR